MITVWSKDGCPKCEQAKAFIEAYHVPVEVKKLDHDFTMGELLERAPGAKEFPQIFDGETHVGSLKDLANYDIVGHSKERNIT